MSAARNRKLLIVQVAGLGHHFLTEHHGGSLCGFDFRPLESIFPAVTCAVQATFRTASLPTVHGIIGNGMFSRALGRPFFWEQSSALVAGTRIWNEFKGRGKKVAMLFWQQSLGESVDIILSPAPIHKHHGGMVEDCYSKPEGLYRQLCDKLGRTFALRHYWGPMACGKSSQWIAEATACMMADTSSAPDLCLTYLPVLDYNLQRFGLDDRRSIAALGSLASQLALLTTAAEKNGYDLLVFGDYAIGNCDKGAVFPNRALAEAGLLALRDISGMKYPDLHASRAFAMADHEIAHVYVRDNADLMETRAVLREVVGVGEVMGSAAQEPVGIAHANTGELMLVAADGWWLAYPWWTERSEAPDYAGHVDIHSKPGYDPCELFWGWPPGSVSQNTSRIEGSHGRVGPRRETAWASTCIDNEAANLLDLARNTAVWLNGMI